MMPERANRTFICSVLFLDIAAYSKKPVSEQIKLKDRFNTLIAESIRDIVPSDRIILDTGDGVGINFLGDPEDALFVAMSLRESFAPRAGEASSLPARIGINLGPVRLVRDLNSQPNIIGDGINVAQRVMGFAKPGQILVSRSYYEVVSHISEGYTKLFSYEGSRTDKHVREHEVYSVGYSNPRGNGLRPPVDRMPASVQQGTIQTSNATDANGTGTLTWFTRLEPWMNSRAIAFGTATLSVGAFALAVAVNLFGHSEVAAVPSSSAELSTQKRAPAVLRPDAANPSPPLSRAEKKARTTSARAQSAQLEGILPTPKSDAAEKKEAKFSPFAFFSSRNSSKETAAIETVAPPAQDRAALITLAIAPWGEVYVDGDRIGVSPPVNEVEVAPGKRTIEIRNGNLPVYIQIVDVTADQKVRIKHKFK